MRAKKWRKSGAPRRTPSFAPSLQIQNDCQQLVQWHCVFCPQKRELVSPLNWSIACWVVTTPFFYLTPAASFGALFSLQTIPTSPENPPVLGRHHSVVFIPETPLCFHRFFLGFFLSSKHLPQDLGNYTHSTRQTAVKKQHSLKRAFYGPPTFCRISS